MRRKDREVLDIQSIGEILIHCKTCHVAMVDDGSPYVVPLSYGFKILNDHMLELYFHSAVEGRKLDVLKRNNKVCFEITREGDLAHAKTPCNSDYYYDCVIGFGDAVFIEDIAEKSKALSIMFKHQVGREVIFTVEQVKNVCVFKVISIDFTGKKANQTLS
jgi:nitroimidazol reductase NimA-like FMN-containing flavoprotein (pyridoxamine 5'-phosphate oxidase superfamily)